MAVKEPPVHGVADQDVVEPVDGMGRRPRGARMRFDQILATQPVEHQGAESGTGDVTSSDRGQGARRIELGADHRGELDDLTLGRRGGVRRGWRAATGSSAAPRSHRRRSSTGASVRRHGPAGTPSSTSICTSSRTNNGLPSVEVGSRSASSGGSSSMPSRACCGELAGRVRIETLERDRGADPPPRLCQLRAELTQLRPGRRGEQHGSGKRPFPRGGRAGPRTVARPTGCRRPRGSPGRRRRAVPTVAAPPRTIPRSGACLAMTEGNNDANTERSRAASGSPPPGGATSSAEPEPITSGGSSRSTIGENVVEPRRSSRRSNEIKLAAQTATQLLRESGLADTGRANNGREPGRRPGGSPRRTHGGRVGARRHAADERGRAHRRAPFPPR